MLQQALQQFGLTKNEADIYLFVLAHGYATPAQIASGTSISRSNTYPVLTSLEGKGLVTQQKDGKKKTYLATDPEALHRTLERKQETIEEILPELRALHVRQKNKPSIEFFEGKTQVKEVYRKVFSAKEVFAIGSTHSLDQIFPRFFPAWIEELKERQIVVHDVLTHASRESAGPMMKGILKGYYDVAYLPQQYDDSPTDMLVWEDSIALITLSEPFFATVISNPLLARSMKMVFGALQSSLRERD